MSCHQTKNYFQMLANNKLFFHISTYPPIHLFTYYYQVSRSLTRAKADLYCIDVSLDLLEASHEAYYDHDKGGGGGLGGGGGGGGGEGGIGQGAGAEGETESGYGPSNWESFGYGIECTVQHLLGY
jgi:hypothetical protein